MAINVAKALNIQNEERGIVFLLLTQSIFLGIFAGAIDVGANSLFLEAYSAKLMPQAFMISGAVGITFTSIYTFLQKRLPFKLFTILNLIVVILLTACLRLGYFLFDDPRVSFIMLVMMGPLIIISMLGFWGTAGRYFTLREGKRLFGIIDTGSIVGMILAFYAVPILVRFNFKVFDTLLIGFGSLILALLFQIIVLRRHELLTIVAAPQAEEKKKKRGGLFALFRNKYTRLMALFVMLSVVTGFVVHYAFMWSTQENYPESRELTSFIGAFFGTMMIFTVIIKSTLYGWLMKNYGLRITLLISPALLLILTVIGAAVGSFFGYTAGAASFTFFFLIMALSKLFNKSLKDAIESPSMKILYQSLDSSERFDVQARIDGVVNELTAFLTGVLMAGLLILSFITVIHFLYILVAVLIIWVVLGILLYNSYRKKLNDSLASAKAISMGEVEKKEGKALSELNMYSDYVQLNPYFLHEVDRETLDQLLTSENARVQSYSWNLVKETLFDSSPDLVEKLLKRSSDPVMVEILEDYKKRLSLNGEQLDAAFRSGNKDKILAALVQTVRDQDTKQVPHIITLLRDRNLQLRAAAIEAAGKLRVKELGSYLVDYLGHPSLYITTWNALVSMGEVILENLENAFYKTGVDYKVQLRIVRAIEAIGGERAALSLYQKIDYHQREIREAAIDGLYSSDFIPSERQKAHLLELIYEVAFAGAENIATEFVIHENDPGNGLIDVLKEERQKTDKLLFKLLGIAYDRNSIEHVQSSIEDEQNQDTGFALELLNLIVDEEVFAYLESYFDDLSVTEKIRRLQNEMPVEILEYDELLIDILNRDGLYMGNFARICTIDAIRMSSTVDASQFLAAQVFHPHPAISRSAGYVLAEKDFDLYTEIKDRKESGFNIDLTALEEGEQIPRIEVIGNVEIMKEWALFSEVDREVVFNFVEQLVDEENIDLENKRLVSFVRSKTSRDLSLDQGFIINLTDYPEKLEQMKYLASEGKLELYQIDRSILKEILFDQPSLLDATRKILMNAQLIEA